MDNLGIGLELLFLGMGVVFITLIVMIAVMRSLGYFTGTNTKKANQPDGRLPEHRENGSADADPSSAGLTSSAGFSGISSETVAAISGAIAYMMSSTQSRYSISSIKPCTGRETISPWAIAGRIELINAGNSLMKRRTSR